MYQIKYILQLSCARTLARKHKSTVRAFLRQFGLGLLEEFFTEEEHVLYLIFHKTISFTLHGSHKERIWYLDIIQQAPQHTYSSSKISKYTKIKFS